MFDGGTGIPSFQKVLARTSIRDTIYKVLLLLVIADTDREGLGGKGCGRVLIRPVEGAHIKSFAEEKKRDFISSSKRRYAKDRDPINNVDSLLGEVSKPK